METFLFIIFAIGYFIMGYYLTKFIRRILTPFNKYLSLIIHSFTYALFFGLGILGSGGEPGFAFPFPIIWTALIYVWKGSPWTLFTNGVIIPLMIWWALIFVIMTTTQYFKMRYENSQNKII